MRVTLLTLVVLAGPAVNGQEPAPPKLTFDVASIRPQTTPSISMADMAGMSRGIRPGGAFSRTHATVASLIMFAYELKDYHIVGGPGWVRQSYFEINARAERPDASDDEIRRMVRSLLEERFRLVARVEEREMRFQALVRARPDGPLGPHLLPIDECSPAFVDELRRKNPETYTSPVGGGVTAGFSSPGARQLADLLTVYLDAPVIDATGLTGCFYFTIRSQFSWLLAFSAAPRPTGMAFPPCPPLSKSNSA